MSRLTINDVIVEVPDGTTVLEAAKAAGFRIPTLCHLEGRKPLGGCRVCLVEVRGGRGLAASCATPATDGMVVKTNTPRVRQARKAVVELLLSEHAGDCQTCDRSPDCELQSLARECGVRGVTFAGESRRRSLDTSTPGITRDTGKCVLCRRCVAACAQVEGIGAIAPQHRGFDTMIGPAFDEALSTVTCVQCGQCVAVCPVGALQEADDTERVWAALADPSKHVVVQTAPAIRAALGECFGMPAGTLVTGRMAAALRRLGFHAVFDTNFTADLTILEEANELLHRLKAAFGGTGGDEPIPMFTSCCPAWINFAEQLRPGILPHLSSCKSPQQMLGAVAKTWYAKQRGLAASDLFVVSVMPCTAKKGECARPEMNSSGARDVDAVLTTRELGRMILQAGIDFDHLPDEPMDDPLGVSTGAADIFANTGGVMEAALRTAYEVITGRPLPSFSLHGSKEGVPPGVSRASIRFDDPLPGFDFLRGKTLNVATVHGLANAREIVDGVLAGTEQAHFVEVMTCPGGCIGGGGQPRMTTDDVRMARIRAIQAEDSGKPIRRSHANPAIQALYEQFLGAPLSPKSRELLHTHYGVRAAPKAEVACRDELGVCVD